MISEKHEITLGKGDRKNEKRAIVSFGKIDFTGNGRKDNPVELEVVLYEGKKGPVFAASADVWNRIRSDIVAGGQMLDELKPFFKRDPLFNKIYEWWKKYHLNDFHPGTKKQEEFLKKYGDVDYDEAVEILKKHGLYEDEGFRYGHGWRYEPIPEKDLKEITDFVENGILPPDVEKKLEKNVEKKKRSATVDFG